MQEQTKENFEKTDQYPPSSNNNDNTPYIFTGDCETPLQTI